MKVFLCYLCLCLPFCFGLECSVTNTTTKSNAEDLYVQSPNYPNIQTESCNYQFNVQEGYQIEVTIEVLEFSSIDTYVLLKPEHDEKDYKFVWSLKKPRKYIIDQSSLNLTFFTKDNKGRFLIRLKRFGELTTTIEPTTIVTWPTPVDNDTIYYTVNLSVSPDIFRTKQTDFKLLMVNMSQKYCEQENILLEKNITTKNINIQIATACSVLWPNYEECIEVRYAIPVYLLQSEKYELTTESLEKMWNTLASEYLKVIGWEEYTIPESNYALLLWLLFCLGILIVFAIILYFARFYSIRFSSNIKRRASDTQQIITPKRVSDASLWPTSNQTIPPLFENENAYVYYEPDAVMKNAQLHQVSTSKMINEDDSSDEEILTVTSTAVSNYNQTIIHLNNNAKESAL